MQQLTHRCPCCDRPLGISWDMWGRYYLCGGCGFTAEDDDDLTDNGKKQAPPGPELNQTAAFHYRRAATGG